MKDLACQKQGNISKNVCKYTFKSRGNMTERNRVKEGRRHQQQVRRVKGSGAVPRREAGACRHLMQVLNHMGSSVCTAQLTRSAPESVGDKQFSKLVYILHSFSVSLFLHCFSPFQDNSYKGQQLHFVLSCFDFGPISYSGVSPEGHYYPALPNPTLFVPFPLKA